MERKSEFWTERLAVSEREIDLESDEGGEERLAFREELVRELDGLSLTRNEKATWLISEEDFDKE